MGAREELGNLGIVTVYDVRRVAQQCKAVPLAIEYHKTPNGRMGIGAEPSGWTVTLNHQNASGVVEVQTTRFGDWQHHSKEAALEAALLYAARLTPDPSFEKLTGMGSALFPSSLAALIKEAQREWRNRLKGRAPHPYSRGDAVAVAAWPEVLDPCVCSAGRIAQIHRGG